MLQEQTILPVGATIPHPAGGRYVIERLLGRGGFGAVYLVRDRHVKQRLFALKEVIDPSRRDHDHFIFEAEVLKRLNHRALPHVYQAFAYEKLKRVYMLMDYIEGQDLDALLHEQPGGRFALPLVLALMTPIVDALIYLHNQNPPIVHRDIKPANIIMQTKSGEAVLVDFGLAKEYVVDNTTNVIRHGSPGYAAPEQYGSGTNPRTDIYGLGATLYTLLTGTVPSDAITRVTGSKRIDPLTPTNLVAPDVPWTVSMVIERAMSISIEDRFATVEEFWHELTNPAPKQQAQPPPPQSFNKAEGELAHAPDRPKVQTPRLQSIDTPLPLTASEQELERITTIAAEPLQEQPRARVTPTLAPSTPQARATTALTPTPVGPVYPFINASYAGTVFDSLNTNNPEHTALYLTHIQQHGGSISGNFQGLGLVGTFKGTVTTTHGEVDFTVTVNWAGVSTLQFEGNIKIGGDLTGNFQALNQEGHPTGEGGIWNASPTP